MTTMTKKRPAVKSKTKRAKVLTGKKTTAKATSLMRKTTQTKPKQKKVSKPLQGPLKKTAAKPTSKPRKSSQKVTSKKALNKFKKTHAPKATTPRPKNTSDADEFVGLGGPSTQQMSDITKKTAEAIALLDQIEDIEVALKKTKEDYNAIVQHTLPEMCISSGVWEFKTNRSKVKIKPIVSGSLPKDEVARRNALTWIDKNGGGSLIKFGLTADFGKGEKGKLRTAKAELKKLGVDAVSKIGIHPQTLCAFVRERLANGENTPLDDLGIWTGHHAKISIFGKDCG